MVWHRENAVNAYLDSVKLCKQMESTCFKKIEPQITEFISAMAAGMNAQLIVEVCSTASPSTVGLAAAARQTGGRFICIVADAETQMEIYKAVKELGLENTTEFVIGDAKEFLPKYPNVDFSLIDCKIEDYPGFLRLLNVNPTRAVVVTNNLFDGKLTATWEKRLEKKVGVKSTTLPLKGSDIYVEKRKDRVKNPQLMARLEQILEEQANKEYVRMISNVASSYDVETFKLLDTEEFSSIRGQLTAIINITFTMVAVFAAVYHVAQTITGDTGMRVLLALTGSVVVGVAETFLYMRYLTGYAKKEEKKERTPRRRATAPTAPPSSRSHAMRRPTKRTTL